MGPRQIGLIPGAGRIDVLLNNAGIGIMGGAEESTIEQAKELVRYPLFRDAPVIQAVLPHMRRQRSRQIINVSSVLGFLPAFDDRTSAIAAFDAGVMAAAGKLGQSIKLEKRVVITLIAPDFSSDRQKAVERNGSCG